MDVLGLFGVEDGIEHAADDETARAALHVIAGTLLIAVLVLKISLFAVEGSGSVSTPPRTHGVRALRADVGHFRRRLPRGRLRMAKGPSYTKQLVGSLLAAVIITLIVIALVTAKIGPGLDARELRERETSHRGARERAKTGSRRTKTLGLGMKRDRGGDVEAPWPFIIPRLSVPPGEPGGRKLAAQVGVLTVGTFRDAEAPGVCGPQDRGGSLARRASEVATKRTRARRPALASSLTVASRSVGLDRYIAGWFRAYGGGLQRGG